MSSTSNRFNKRELLWVIVVLACSAGIALWSTTPRALGPVLDRTLSITLLGLGLGELYATAAFGSSAGPRTLHRARYAAVNTGMALWGMFSLLPQPRAYHALGALALIVIAAAAFRTPKGA